MKTIHVSFLGKVFSDQRGQTLVWMGFLLVALMATGGFTVDVGHYYMVRSETPKQCQCGGVGGRG